ncbi:MAG: DUF4962 domain-containing protein [Armatimonadetes bacterium]|nr:DUF4962 domain-containing protein [Armatimonadota bacterium]
MKSLHRTKLGTGPNFRRRSCRKLGPVPNFVFLLAACALASPQSSLVTNGEFDQRGPDGWAEGWEKLQLTADCTVDMVESDTEPGTWAVRIAGQSRLSKGGLRAPLAAFEGPPVVRVSLRYQGWQGKQSVIVRPQGTDPKDTKVGERLLLEPSRTWRPGGGILALKPGSGEAPGALEIVLLHEGPGETWFDGLQVSAGEGGPRPAQPTMAPMAALPPGPYLVGFYPEDTSTVVVNPPRFRWPGQPGSVYTLEWSQSPDFPADSTQKAEALTLNVYIPPEPLAPGQWYWRVTAGSGVVPGPGPGETPPEEGGGKVETGAEEMQPADEGAETEETPAKPPPKKKPERKRPPKEASPILLSVPVFGQEAPPEQPPPAPKPRKPRKPKPGQQETTPTPPDETAAPAEEEGAPPEDMGTEEPGEEPDFGQPPVRPPPTATSSARAFRIDESAVSIPVPEMERLLNDLPPHPRIWVTVDSLLALRSLIAGPLKADWDALLTRLNAAKGAELATEPKTKGKWRNPSPKDLENNDAIFETASKEAWLVRDFAFVALVSGDQAYADEAKRRALSLAAWDVKGSTGYVSHDQAFREILLSLALVEDWLPQSLTEEEKQKVSQAVIARGNELHSVLSTGLRPINLYPLSSHGQTAVGFLTVVALAVAGDTAEADEWLRFALPTAVGLFAPWAGDDGGWMQGETYWKRSAPFTFELFDALKTTAGIDLYQLPWTRNTAKYKTYMQPPYSTRGGFGDGPEMPPDAGDRLAMWRLASALNDPRAAWYAANVTAPTAEVTVFDLLWHDPNIQPQAPESLPPSAAFMDSGLFAMDSSLVDPRGVRIRGRASRFGSFNHAHADQGHFTLEAFGEPLLIDAGYYDFYRSPHASSFSRTTLAHNTLLVNGNLGQRTDDITARGKIESFLHTQAVDTALVQAAEAYPPQLLESYRRRFVFLRPDRLVIFDRVEAPQKARYAWLLHSLEQPTLDAAASTALIRKGSAAALVGAFGPGKLAWSTSKAFPKNPRFTETDVAAPAQWHTSIKSATATEAEDLILLVLPFEGETAPVAKALEVTNGKGAEATSGQARLSRCSVSRRLPHLRPSPSANRSRSPRPSPSRRPRARPRGQNNRERRPPRAPPPARRLLRRKARPVRRRLSRRKLRRTGSPGNPGTRSQFAHDANWVMSPDCPRFPRTRKAWNQGLRGRRRRWSRAT